MLRQNSKWTHTLHTDITTHKTHTHLVAFRANEYPRRNECHVTLPTTVCAHCRHWQTTFYTFTRIVNATYRTYQLVDIWIGVFLLLSICCPHHRECNKKTLCFDQNWNFNHVRLLSVLLSHRVRSRAANKHDFINLRIYFRMSRQPWLHKQLRMWTQSIAIHSKLARTSTTHEMRQKLLGYIINYFFNMTSL